MEIQKVGLKYEDGARSSLPVFPVLSLWNEVIWRYVNPLQVRESFYVAPLRIILRQTGVAHNFFDMHQPAYWPQRKLQFRLLAITLNQKLI